MAGVEYTPDERKRHLYLLRTYGVSLEQYRELLAQQGGGCALCDRKTEELGRALAVDHDHKTGEVRGLLCNYCNHRLVGRHRDGALLRRIAEYVERHTGWFVPPKPKRRRKTRKVK